MKNYSRLVIMTVALFALSACESEQVKVLKSPCVGIDGSPCGPKRNVNGWMNPSQPVDRS